MYNYPEYAPEEEKDPYDELWEQIKGDICEEASIKKCDDTEIADWKEIQPRINYWGTQFSIASKADKVRAVDNICALVDKLTKKYDPGNPKKADEYEAAVSTLRKKYGRVDSAPVKYVGIIYPDNVFYLALSEVLGFGVSEAGNLLGRVYDHTKGASFTTHFFNVLRYSVLDCFDKYKKTARNTSLSSFTEKDEENMTGQDDHFFARAAADRDSFRKLFEFAKLTEAVGLACKNKTVRSGKPPLSKINHTHLRLFYTLHLINFTRYSDAQPRDAREEKAVMSAAEKGFELFATNVREQDTAIYKKLAAAAFSQRVLTKKGLTKSESGYTVLSDKACALYSNTPASTLSDRFASLRKNLELYQLFNKEKV
ncbi:MAG: hypothetical protein E7647_02805 [Ruminococcaceae bacterium]|nr:hypothetical protein [Oscillospiraceae bacterium]